MCSSTNLAYSVVLVSSAVSLFIIVRYIDSPLVLGGADGGGTMSECVFAEGDATTLVERTAGVDWLAIAADTDTGDARDADADEAGS